MGLSLDSWNNIKWGLAVIACAFLVYEGKLDTSLLMGLITGALMPVTNIAQIAGVVEQPKN